MGFGNWICFNCWKYDVRVIDVSLLVILILILCHWFKFIGLISVYMMSTLKKQPWKEKEEEREKGKKKKAIRN